MITETKIGFIGGCAITQKNIPKEDRFIEVFKHNIKLNESVNPSFALASYNQFYQLEFAAHQLIHRKKVDRLILHLRPQAFITSSKFIIKGQGEKQKVSVFINPILLKNKEHQMGNKSAPEFREMVSKPQLMGMNIFLGRILGINKRLSKLVFDAVSKIHLLCKENHVQLMILGIPPQRMTKQGNIVCKQFNAFLHDKCKHEGIDYLECFSAMDEDCFLEDQVHLSIKGHHCLGNILFEGMTGSLS